MGSRLEGKRALVSAAGQGIGRASAIAMAAEGAQVFATDINADTLADLASENHAGIETFVMDVRDDASVAQGVERAAPDVLFNCAGFVHHGAILDATDNDWEFAFDLNVRSMLRTIRAALPGMLARGVSEGPWLEVVSEGSGAVEVSSWVSVRRSSIVVSPCDG
jgi:2-keto-3-deoxy-L-fuconate dehydrogenase